MAYPYCTKISRHVHLCRWRQKMAVRGQKPYMSLYVLTCPYMSLYVLTCPYMSLQDSAFVGDSCLKAFVRSCLETQVKRNKLFFFQAFFWGRLCALAVIHVRVCVYTDTYIYTHTCMRIWACPYMCSYVLICAYISFFRHFYVSLQAENL